MAAAVVLLSACVPALKGKVILSVPPASARPFKAGAAKVDITPPPGFPMGGHSLAGKVSRGTWTRLHARALYMEVAKTRLVLVSTDLWSFPGGLGERVIEVLAAKTSEPALGREEVIFAATHTHQSPGNFSTSKFYNEMASRWARFDERLFEFLADRIAKAIADARRAAKPATLSMAHAPVKGLQVNRSLEAFLLNPEAAGIRSSSAPTVTRQVGFPVHPDAYKAVDPRLVVLRVSSLASLQTVAIAAFVAAHNTSMAHVTELYTGDFFGIAADLVERRLQASSPGVVVAIFNGAEGDISPIWRWQDRRDAYWLGNRLSTRIMRLASAAEALDTSKGFRFGFRLVEIAGVCVSGNRERCTADKPMMGIATVGGAEDGRSGFWELGWKEGITGPPRGNQGRKQPPIEPPFVPLKLPFVKSMTRLLFPLGKGDVPRRAPVGIYSIDNLALVTLPGEFTTSLGKRVATAVTSAMGAADTRTVVLVGLANEYISYFATPEEYDAQHYEGSSTIYGRESGSVFTEAVSELARGLSGYLGTRPSEYKYKPGKREEFGVDWLGARPAAGLDHLRAIAVDRATGNLMQGLPTACWIDGVPRLKKSYGPTSLTKDTHNLTPRVRVETSIDGAPWTALLDPSGSVEDDSGFDLLVYVLVVEKNQATWCATWMPPSWVRRADPAIHRFRVTRLSGSALSCPFVMNHAVRFAHLNPCR